MRRSGRISRTASRGIREGSPYPARKPIRPGHNRSINVDYHLGMRWRSGNASEIGAERRGWILGHFIDPAEGVLSSKNVEVKWGVHPAGERRAEWTSDDQRTTLLLMVQGNFRLDLTEASVTMAKQGDYVVWGPGIDHSWEAIEDSVVVTVRWPSSPGESRPTRILSRAASRLHR